MSEQTAHERVNIRNGYRCICGAEYLYEWHLERHLAYKEAERTKR